jgi:hypothetical protein
MAIIPREHKKPVIDLAGPEGNAFFLLGTAQNLMKQLKYDEEEIKEIMNLMKASDYDNLIAVFNEHFGEYVDLMTP